MQKPEYPQLKTFFKVYFPPFWTEIYIWDETEPNYQMIIQLYVRESTEAELLLAIKELERLLDHQYSEADLDKIAGLLGLNLYLPGMDIRYKDWLEEVLNVLKNSLQSESDNQDN